MIKVEQIAKIQELRAVQALTDIGIDIYINSKEEYKFALLKRYFGFSYKTFKQSDFVNHKELISFDHSKPSTSILYVTKPLIFSKQVPLFLKGKWKNKRKINFVFFGKLTENRKLTIQSWIDFNFKRKVELNRKDYFYLLIIKLLSHFRMEKLLIRTYGDLYVWFSNRGRTYPHKTWDSNYYDLLLKSKFVLCPSGDYVWTYRFFESILCGAIPIVEEVCQSYEGFKFYLMTDHVSTIKWTEEIVNYNFKLCVERITLSGEDIKVLKYEIMKMSKVKI